MKFNPANHNTAKTIINSLKIKTSVWMADHRTGEPQDYVAKIMQALPPPQLKSESSHGI